MSILDLAFRLPLDTNIGADGSLYTAASRAWLGGGDPWQVQVGCCHYANLPPTVLAFTPFTLVPDAVAGHAWVGICALAAVWTLRRLRMPLWWLAFPPLFEGIYVGNPHVLILALLVGGRLSQGLAPFLKIYAVVPLFLRLRGRAMVIAVVAVALSVIAAPNLWSQYFGELPTITARIDKEAVGGFSATWLAELLVAPTALCLFALWLVRRDEAAWLVVPALWPASQFLYASFAVPVASPGLSVFLAIPQRGVAPIAISVYAAVSVMNVWGRERARRTAQAGTNA